MRATIITLLALTALTACAHHGRHRDKKSDKTTENPGPTSLGLPTGLVGDGQQHVYSEPSPR